MHHIRRGFLLPAVTFLLLACLCLAAAAAQAESGSCGPDAQWKMGKKGVLTISGEGRIGELNDQTLAEAGVRADKVRTVVIEDGITEISGDAFRNLSRLTGATLPRSVLQIDRDAFGGSTEKCTFTVDKDTYAEAWAANNGYRAKVIVPVASISLSETSVTVDSRKGVTLKGKAEPADASVRTLVWSSSDPSVATVRGGKVKPVGAGVCDIICEAEDGRGARAVCRVEVILKAKNLSFKKKSVTLSISESVRPAVRFNPEKVNDPRLEWSSSDPETASVDENGVITGRKRGECTVTAVTMDGSNKKASLKVRVLAFGVLPLGNTLIENDTSLVAQIILPEGKLSSLKFGARSNVTVYNQGSLLFISCYEGGEETITVACGREKIEFPVRVLDEDDIIETEDYYYYLNEDGTATLTECRLNDPEEIPSSVDGHTVTALGAGLYEYTQFERPVVPDTVRIIGSSCFNGSGAKEIVLPEGLTALGNDAFSNTDITEIRIPASVTLMCGNPFSECGSLETVAVAEGNPYFTIRGDALMDTRDNRMIWYPVSKMTEEWTVPDGVREVGSGFIAKAPVRKLTIPASVRHISSYGITDCDGLEEIVMEEGVEILEPWAFQYGGKFRSVRLPDTLKEIGDGIFRSSASMAELVIPRGVEKIGDYNFDRSGDFAVTVQKGSYAEKYCRMNDVRYKYPE